jgi:glycerol kinase
VQWARDNLKLIASASEAEALCESVDDNGGVFIVPAFAGLFAPYWRSDARGVICGLTAFNTGAHLVRACVEAAAYQVKDILDAMGSDSGVRLHALRCDGGMTANAFLMQFQADLLDVTVTVPTITETTALGAACAAGLAVGFYPDLATLRAQWSVRREWTAHLPAAQSAFLVSRWAMAIERSLDWHAPAARQGASECERLEMVRSGSSRVALDRALRAKGEGVSASAWAVRAAALTALVLCAFASGRASGR